MSAPGITLQLSVAGAARVVSELRAYLGPYARADDDPLVPPLDRAGIRISTPEATVRLTMREAYDLFNFLGDLVETGASGPENHDHIYADDYREVAAAWIDPDGGFEPVVEIVTQQPG